MKLNNAIMPYQENSTSSVFTVYCDKEIW